MEGRHQWPWPRGGSNNSSGNSSGVVVSWGLLGSLEFHDGVLGTLSGAAVSLGYRVSTISRPRGCSCLKERSRGRGGWGQQQPVREGRREGDQWQTLYSASQQSIQVTLCSLLGRSWRFGDESLRCRYTHGEWQMGRRCAAGTERDAWGV